MNKIQFKAEVKKQLALRKWTYKDLERETGYTHGSIQVMMSDDNKLSKAAIKAFADALGIKVTTLINRSKD